MILIVFGLPGTGKTYFARRLAEEINASYFNTDQVRKELHLEGQYDQKSKTQVYDQIRNKLEEVSGNGKDVIVDGTFHLTAVRDAFIDQARKLDEPIAFVEMKASDKTIEKRMQSEREHSDADYKVYLQVKYDFEEMNEPHLVLVSEVQPIDEMIKNTKSYLDAKRTDSESH